MIVCLAICLKEFVRPSEGNVDIRCHRLSHSYLYRLHKILHSLIGSHPDLIPEVIGIDEELVLKAVILSVARKHGNRRQKDKCYLVI